MYVCMYVCMYVHTHVPSFYMLALSCVLAHVTRGFNATYRVHTCAEECRDLCTVDNDRCVNGIAKCDPTPCMGNHTCVGDVCECREGFTGPDCSVELCPFNCSSGTGQGFCLEV